MDTGLPEYTDTTPRQVVNNIETNIWLAELLDVPDTLGLRDEHLRAAWREYIRYEDVINVFAGADLGTRLRAMMVTKADHILREFNR